MNESSNRVTGAWLAGMLLAVSALAQTHAQTPAPTQRFDAVAEATSALMRQRLYDPGWTADTRYAQLEQQIAALAAKEQTREAFVADFNQLWQGGPFSHVQLSVARGNAEQLAAHLDQLRVGGGGAALRWEDDVAVLTVNTMMGLDTIEQVDAAFDEIVRRSPRALVLDLRANQGGAFVSRALVSHLISEPLDLGWFISRRWHDRHQRLPLAEDAQSLSPWDGWTLSSFWQAVQEQPLTRIQVQPVAPLYDGPVAVLVSGQTASAAELTADALRARSDVLLIGEPTAGQMLSQAPFDLPTGLQLMLPVADYYSRRSGRIEGQGLKPDIEVEAGQALQVALTRFGG